MNVIQTLCPHWWEVLPAVDSDQREIITHRQCRVCGFEKMEVVYDNHMWDSESQAEKQLSSDGIDVSVEFRRDE